MEIVVSVTDILTKNKCIEVKKHNPYQNVSLLNHHYILREFG